MLNAAVDANTKMIPYRTFVHFLTIEPNDWATKEVSKKKFYVPTTHNDMISYYNTDFAPQHILYCTSVD